MKPLLDRLLGHIEGAQKLTLARVPDGFDALILADLTRALARKAPERAATLVMVARDAQRQAQLEAGMAFVAPELEVLTFPNWDCQPYDRVSPNGAIVARRMTVLSRLARSKAGADKPRLLIVTANGLVQRVPRRDKMAAETFSCAPGNMIDIQALAVWLEHHGYLRGPTVRETGEYAVRGGIVDLFPPGLPTPIRLDFFGDTLESIRSFDPETQRSVGQMRALDLVPMSEVQLTSETIKRFRQSYVAQFGAATPSDTLYEAISEGRRYAGLEHWLPLFHDGLDTLFDYLPRALILLGHQVEEAKSARVELIQDYFQTREDFRRASPEELRHLAHEILQHLRADRGGNGQIFAGGFGEQLTARVEELAACDEQAAASVLGHLAAGDELGARPRRALVADRELGAVDELLRRHSDGPDHHLVQHRGDRASMDGVAEAGELGPEAEARLGDRPGLVRLEPEPQPDRVLDAADVAGPGVRQGVHGRSVPGRSTRRHGNPATAPPARTQPCRRKSRYDDDFRGEVGA